MAGTPGLEPAPAASQGMHVEEAGVRSRARIQSPPSDQMLTLRPCVWICNGLIPWLWNPGIQRPAVSPKLRSQHYYRTVDCIQVEPVLNAVFVIQDPESWPLCLRS